MPGSPARRLIVTADDFGVDEAVNEAVEQAHLHGILSAASLMAGAPAAADAVARAKRLPALKVGLHVALVDATPVLPPERVPDLVGADGRFSKDLVKAGISFFFRPRVRAQLRAEIAAQFEAFRATGLVLDHVNCHNHMQMHPTVAGLILDIGRAHGLVAMRVPLEPQAILARAEAGAGDDVGARALALWTKVLSMRLARAGVAAPDAVFGLAWTGHVTEERLLALLPHLPPGTSELYAHPATRTSPPLKALMPTYDQPGEFAALTSPKVKAAIEANGISLVGYRDMAD
jgi:hopanoid biosynthesis associated protein HpnK